MTAGPFGPLLRSLRERAGLTQDELAERAGLTTHAISALERGTRTHPYPHTVRSLADALGLPDLERSGLIRSVPRRRSRDSGVAQEARVNVASATSASEAVGLVVPPTRLYGRDGDVAALCEMVGSGSCRLITLTGPGGVGKTRLAVAVGEQLAVAHPDGVVHVGLAALADASDVVPTIARALNLAGADRANALDLVATHLGPLRLLLVLDNLEHLLSAATDVGVLASRCPTVTVLVASRSPLRIRGEREYVVAPLAVPGMEVRTPDQLACSASGALMLDRAAAVAPSLPVTTEDVSALAELCRRVAGIPLAIELAAVRLRSLSPQTLLDRLESVSAAGPRDLPERQRTMRATLDWSYGLLAREQQALFRMLSVFRGGGTLNAIEMVSEASGAVAAGEVIELLELLVEQSLVVVRRGLEGEHRYDMLEPIAQYARSLLSGPDAAAAVHAHSRVYADLVERAAAGYERSDQLLWLARTQADQANILVAVDRSISIRNGETAARIVWAMWLYWWLRGQSSAGLERAQRCLRVELSPDLLARVHLTAATMAYAGGDQRTAGEHWGEAFRLGTQENDPEVASKARCGTGLAALGGGDLDAAETLFREALRLGLAAGESGVWIRSMTHVFLGTILLLKADPGTATLEIERGLQLAQERGDRLATYVALYNLSQAALATGEHRRARTYLERGIALSEQTQDLANLAYFLDTLAVVESAENASARVPVLLGAAQSLRETAGATIYGYYLPDVSLRDSAEQDAQAALGEDAYDDGLDAGRALDLPGIVEFALRSRN